MTAIVGVLNKHAVAIAADSAITTTGLSRRKVFNRGNKIFTLSKFHPVGVMIYNNAALEGVPWDVIIKLYRRSLGDKSFPKLEDYKKDFIRFIYKKNFFIDKSIQLSYLSASVQFIITNLIGNEAGRLCGGIRDDNHDDFLSQMKRLMRQYSDLYSSTKQCESLSGYKIDDFVKYSSKVFDDLINSLNQISPDKEFREYAETLIFNMIKSEHDNLPFTGIVFVGYGEDDIYPKLDPVNISLVIDNKLRYYDDINNSVEISDKNSSAIQPFAQTDVMDTVLLGIDPKLEKLFIENFKKTITKYGNMIAEGVDRIDPQMAAKIRDLDISGVVNEFRILNRELKRKQYIIPLVRAISSLEKEDLIDVAESLISLTSLKRRMTFEEESVGGPVDVAVISKGGGFIWVKRKHYFDPNLNDHFFKNYYR